MCRNEVMVLMRLIFQFACAHFVASTIYQSIPIGAVFNRDSTDLIDAFQYAVLVHNMKYPYPKLKIMYAPVSIANINNRHELTAAICNEINKKRIFAMFGDSKPETYNIIQTFSKVTRIPYLVSTTYRFYNESPYDVSLEPPYMDAVVDIIKHYQWRRVFYVYDRDDALRRLEGLYSSFSFRNKPAIYARPLLSLGNIHEELRKIDRYNAYPKMVVVDLENRGAYHAFLTACNSLTIIAPTASYAVQTVMDVGMNKDGYHYLICGYHLESLNLTRFQLGGVNITGFRIVNTKQRYFRMFHRQWKDSRKDELFPKLFDSQTNLLSTESALLIDAVRLFATALEIVYTRYHNVLNYTTPTTKHNRAKGDMSCWMHPRSRWRHGSTILRALTQVKMKGLTGHVEIGSDGQRKNFKLDVMEMKYKTPLRKVGTWTNKNGYVAIDHPPVLQINRSSCALEERGSPKCPFRITTKEVAPFVSLKSESNETTSLEGYCIDLIDRLAQMLNFKYTIHLVKDKEYGMKKNNQWNGMIGEILRKEADMAVAPLTITEERQETVGFSTPFMKTGISIMIKRPQIQKPGVFSFMSPLSNDVWLCVAIGFISVCLIMFTVGRLNPYEKNSENCTRAESQFTFANTTWSALGALMQQGSEIYPISMAGRVLSCVWWFFTLILVSSYTANLAAFLTVENFVIPIKSADDLLKQTKIAYGIRANGSTMEFFKKSRVPVYQQMWEHMQLFPEVFKNSTDDGIQTVRKSKGEYAFLLESSINEYNSQRKPCDIIRVGSNLDTKGYGIATGPNSPMREKLSVAVLNLTENGELHKLYQKWWYSKGECRMQEKQGKAKSPMTLSNVRGIFYILIGGLAFSVVFTSLVYLIASIREDIKQKHGNKNNVKSERQINVDRTAGRRSFEMLPDSSSEEYVCITRGTKK